MPARGRGGRCSCRKWSACAEYIGADKHDEFNGGAGDGWNTGEWRSTVNALLEGALNEMAVREQLMAKMRSKVEHPFRSIQCKSGYRGLR